MLDTNAVSSRLSELLEQGDNQVEAAALIALLNGVADYKKKCADLQTAQTDRRYELGKYLAAIIVPFLTLFTLTVTIYFQWDQSRLNSKTREDSQWRTVVDTMTKPPSPTADIVITTALAPFYDSERYRSQAFEMTFLLASRISDEGAFETLFRDAWVNAGWNNMDDMRRLGVAVERNYQSMNQAFTNLGGAERLEALAKVSHSSFKMNGEMDIFQIAHARGEALASERFLSNLVADVLRTKRPKSAGLPNFSGFPFFQADLSSVDFTDIDVDDADFTGSIVTGAILKPKSFGNSVWDGVAWWTAAEVSPDLLQSLLKSTTIVLDSPDQKMFTLGGVQFSKADYDSGVARLCKQAKIVCKLT